MMKKQVVHIKGGSMELLLRGSDTTDPLFFYQNPKGSQLWEAAHALACELPLPADLLPDAAEDERMIEVIELGSGAAPLPAMAIAAALPNTHVVVTDLEPEVVQMAQKNLELNGVENAEACVLDFSETVPEELEQRFDVVLASDVSYVEEEVLSALSGTIDQLLVDDGTLMLARKERRDDAERLLEQKLSERFQKVQHLIDDNLMRYKRFGRAGHDANVSDRIHIQVWRKRE